jgi:hypothetical protein
MLLKSHTLLLLVVATLIANIVTYYYEVDITYGSNRYHCIVVVDLSSDGSNLVEGQCHLISPPNESSVIYLTSSSRIGSIIAPYLLSGKEAGKVETEFNGSKLIMMWKLITKQKFTMLSYDGVLVVSLISGVVVATAAYVLLNRDKYIID